MSKWRGDVQEKGRSHLCCGMSRKGERNIFCFLNAGVYIVSGMTHYIVTKLIPKADFFYFPKSFQNIFCFY